MGRSDCRYSASEDKNAANPYVDIPIRPDWVIPVIRSWLDVRMR
jgi:hypothetical protein